jgi:hypothetical protein
LYGDDIDEDIFLEFVDLGTDPRRRAKARVFFRNWVRGKRPDSKRDPIVSGDTGFQGPQGPAISTGNEVKEVADIDAETTILNLSHRSINDLNFATVVEEIIEKLKRITLTDGGIHIDLSFNHISGIQRPGNNLAVDASLLRLAYDRQVKSINVTYNPIATIDRANLWLRLPWRESGPLLSHPWPTEQVQCHHKIIWIPFPFVSNKSWHVLVPDEEDQATVRDYHIKYYSLGHVEPISTTPT